MAKSMLSVTIIADRPTYPLSITPKPDTLNSTTIRGNHTAMVCFKRRLLLEIRIRHAQVFSAGACVIHAGETWHGSGANLSGEIMRRSIGVHMVPDDAVFSDMHGGYIYRRYQRTGSNELDESFFPVLHSDDGTRTPWINHYCETGRR